VYVKKLLIEFSELARCCHALLVVAVVLSFVTSQSGCSTITSSSAAESLQTYRQTALSDSLHGPEIQFGDAFLSGFQSVSDLFVSPSGFLYVLDNQRHYLHRFDLNQADVASTADSLGGRGSRSTQFDRPAFVDASNDMKIYISDVGNDRIQQFDRRFQPLGTVTLGDGLSGLISYRPAALVSNSLGELIFWDEDSGKLRKINASMQLDQVFNPAVNMIRSSPVSIINNHEGFILADSEAGILFRYSSTGRYIGFWSLDAGIRDVTWHKGLYFVLYSEKIMIVEPNGNVSNTLKVNPGQLRRIFGYGDDLIVADASDIYRVEINLLLLHE
jgi:hypothetical protein